jgi:MotA/TolQ/ExbB proton channel family
MIMQPAVPTTSPHLPNPRPNSKAGHALAVIGSVFLFAPLVGVSITAITMIREFNRLSASMPATDPASKSASIGYALVATVIGYGVSLLGAGLVAIAIWGCRYTAPWLWSTLITAPVLWLPGFPFGTILAMVAIGALLRARDFFRPSQIAF